MENGRINQEGREKNSRLDKETLINEIIDKGLFVVFDYRDKSQWFELKDGSFSQFFFDMSRIVSHPAIFEKINQYAVETIKENGLVFNRIMGIPYGGLPFAYGIASSIKAPCIAARREGKKKYGTKGDFLGEFKKGDRVLFIEDAIATAKTVMSFAKRLKEDGLIVKDVVALLDTELTGRQNLNDYGIDLYNLFTWNDFVKAYKKSSQNKINPII